ncbi:hypothetical protein AAFF_G00384910 [Aldrovandia affinis]|uniref:G-protein coupled receptors family 1 profile domain-containing protein n=1 Tax=Aldrovandia affinis TaxID=143900 RepID=A0AAD7SEY4_9TELE|nr:hypothetical protein AAFF_G00384910 [Aldrovandia affinis]
MDPNATAPNQSCNLHDCEEVAQVLFPLFYILVFLMSVSGNGLVLYVVWAKRKKLNSTSLYLINLALSDMLFTLALPGRIAYYVRCFDWPFGDLACRLTSVVFYANTYAGIGFMTCISLDRYLAMVHPHRLPRLRTARAGWVVCALVWLLVSVENVPLLFKEMLVNDGDRRICREHGLGDFPSLPYRLLLVCTINFCFPLVVILFCYAQVNSKLSRAAKHNPVTHRSVHSQRAGGIILLILLTFVVCFSPYHINTASFGVRVLLRQPSCEEQKAFKTPLLVTISMMNVNCCLDPVLYFLAIKTYRQRVLSLFGGHVSTSVSPVPTKP